MSPPRSRALSRVRELYSAVPDAGCKGLCGSACVPIYMSNAEAAAVRAAAPAGVAGRTGCSAFGAPRCPLLTSDGRCSVYDVRPMICRLWGVSSNMRCPHGCAPRGGLLSVQECLELMLLSLQIGGSDHFDDHALADVQACVSEPGLAEAVMDLMQGDYSAVRRIGPLLNRVLRPRRQQAVSAVQEALRRLRVPTSSESSPPMR